MPARTIGSLWGKWDLHFHTPSSFDYQKKDVTNEEIVEILIGSGIVAVAVTDHHKLDVERIKSLQALGAGKLTVFPGIELRSELGGSESVHLIGIFSETADPVFLWTKIQGQLDMTPTEVLKKGDDHVYVNFRDAAHLIHELGGYVSVHVGRKANSIENIGNEQPYKRAFKEDLAREYIDLFEVGRVQDIKSYQEIVFPSIGFERPLIISSDNHNILDYVLKASCWIKADPTFSSFQQIKSDPQERVYIGDIPPAVDHVLKNSTKYLKSISFEKISDSNLQEDWFSGTVPLNPGLVAVIGNKGTGKTALVETIGLLGNTAKHKEFSFLNAAKFRHPRNNKAKHFQATLEWVDGHSSTKLLSDSVSMDALEAIVYIPQHYLETICNEIQTTDSSFDRELKSVIFSHVDNSTRLQAATLDQLIEFRTEQIRLRVTQLHLDLRHINEKILKLEKESSEESKQFLLQQIEGKTRELEAHDKTKPIEVAKPQADPTKQAQLQSFAQEIERTRAEKNLLSNKLEQAELDQKNAALRQAIAGRLFGRLSNFELLYESLMAEAADDCSVLGLEPKNIVKLQLDKETPTQIAAQAQAIVEASLTAKESIENERSKLQKRIDELSLLLDLPNAQYQKYVEEFEDWKRQGAELTGDQGQVGSMAYLQNQLKALDDIPGEIANLTENRTTKVRSIYKQLELLVGTFRSLYSPVQQFIENYEVTAGKFGLEFEASIVCMDFPEKLFSFVNQARKGSFYGVEEGRKVLMNLIDSADFETEDGAVKFIETLYDYLTHDKRESRSPSVSISDQLKQDAGQLDVLDLIFSLSYLSPRYKLRWSGKNIEQLSPGERGALLLIFYLLIDRRDSPLILDQPEENLDNQTVYDLLAPCIQEARKRRQVIIVTHNPNLAVVCDADQVIRCSIEKESKNKATYTAGALENFVINQFAIDVLEGTRPAFDRRDSKYQERGSSL